MKAEKDKNTGKWLIQFRYTNWQGERKKTTKRGFNTKREAEEWVRNFLMSQQADFNMNFEEFVKIYRADVENRIRPTTGETKDNIIDKKILPYFGKKSVNSITAADIRNWQNIMMSLRKKNGKPYSETYLHTINNQLSAIFNYAVKFYDLANNPCRKAGSMGRKQADEMRFLTVDEFSKFIDGVMDKQKSYVTFMTLFWTGMRLGEMLALTPADIDFENKTIRIDKSYDTKHKTEGPTKTYTSTRTITAPEFLLADIKDYMNSVYGLKKNDRLFGVTKYYMEHEKERALKNSGLDHVRIHDLRHSHCALLFEMGIPPLEVKERLGHKNIETTLNVYAHVYPGKQRVLSDKLDKVYKEGLQSGKEE